jgi:cytidyltransferase-like protein
MSEQKRIVVSGGFDDMRSRDLRFLHEASKLGEVTALLWGDEMVERHTGHRPKFGFAERQYLLKALRYVSRVHEATGPADGLPEGTRAEVWADCEATANGAREKYARENGMSYRVFRAEELAGFLLPAPMPSKAGRKKIVATGCYDWIHSGHVRFCEEVSALGDLYIILGRDANIRLLKGEGHPLHPEAERRYGVASVKYVKEVRIGTGTGWLDADPEIREIKPDIYAVNEDGDRGGKREYCERLGIEYLVLKRAPAPGLPRRSSTELRGF